MSTTTQPQSLSDSPLLNLAKDSVISELAKQTSESIQWDLKEGLAVAKTLSSMGLAETVICSSLLTPLVQNNLITPEQVRKKYKRETYELVNDLIKLDNYSQFNDIDDEKGLSPRQAEGLRKLLLAIVDDIRLVLVRLAQQIHRLIEAKDKPDAIKHRLAQETQEVFAPIANRLGIWQLKWELEDLSFRYLHPERYKEIAKYLASKRSERETYIEDFKLRLLELLATENIVVDVQGRPKHIFSIWKKMQRKSLSIDSLFDIRAVRIITESVADCYSALGLVHSTWKYVPSEFDDYVANPKSNNYQSIHTAVFGPENKVVEIQIRTQEMHDSSELGVAAHWRYKEGKKQETGLDEKINWLRQVLENQNDDKLSSQQSQSDDGDLIQRFQESIFEDRVYAVSPRGDVVDLPAGGTPLDFAYHIHTDVGHRCRGALVNGNIVPLTYSIQNGDRVEILTSKTGKPSRDWLIEGLGYIASSRSREKIRSWFRQQDQEENLRVGKQLLERELSRLSYKLSEPDKLAQQSGFPNYTALCISLGAGAISLGDITSVIIKGEEEQEEPSNEVTLQRQDRRSKSSGQVAVSGVDDLLMAYAQCCKPVPPEKIVGYITQGKGITVHRVQCSNLKDLMDKRPERVFPVNWHDEAETDSFVIDIAILAYDRKHLIRDITALLSEEKIPILEMSCKVDKKEMSANVKLQIEIPNLEQMGRLLNKLDALPTIYSVERT